MAEQLQIIQQKAPSFLEHALAITVTTPATKREAAQALVEAKMVSRAIERLGEVPIASAKKAYEEIKAHYAAINTPFEAAYAHLEKQIKDYWAKEYEAATELLEEEIVRAESTGDLVQIIDLGAKTEKTELGQMQIKRLKAFDFGTILKDGKPIPGADLSYANTDLQDLPKQLFKLDVTAFKKYVESGLCQREDLRHYHKPSITVKEP